MYLSEYIHKVSTRILENNLENILLMVQILTNSHARTPHCLILYFRFFSPYSSLHHNKEDQVIIRHSNRSLEIYQRPRYTEWKTLFMHTLTLSESRKTPPMSSNQKNVNASINGMIQRYSDLIQKCKSL